MPAKASKGAQTKQHIAQVAQRLFKLHGFDGVGIDTIMREAGLTRGGFYAHFSNKAELLAHAVRAELDTSRNPVLCMAPGPEKLRAFIEHYVSLNHAEDIAGGCPATGLATTVASGGAAAQQTYENMLSGMKDLLSACIDQPDAQDIAMRILTTCIGGLTLARAVHNPTLAQNILEQARIAAHALIPAP